MKRSVTVDLDELFDDLSYYDQISFIADKICDQRMDDKMKLVSHAFNEIEIMEFIRRHTDTALKVLKGDGYTIH